MQINSQLILTADGQPPTGISPWIDHKDSLTEKLQQITGSADLVVLSQNWAKASYWDLKVLNLQDEQVFQREILMRSHDKDYWYARSVIPESCYALEPSFFDRLQKESIKNLIFDNPKVVRLSIENYAVNHQCLEFYWVKKYIPDFQGVIWIRFSQYLFSGLKIFYLLELLLPELEYIS